MFSSNRKGTLGAQHIWVATRASTADPWSPPVNAWSNVNTSTASETRPSLSWHADQLLLGRSPGAEGGSNVYISTRDKIKGGDR